MKSRSAEPTRAIQPRDISAAVRWYTGVDPRAHRQTRAVGRALSLERCALRYGLGMTIREVADYYRVNTSAIVRHTAHAPAEIRGAVTTVMMQAAIERDRDLRAEAAERRLEALQAELLG